MFNKITFKSIPESLDKNKLIIIDGDTVGELCRGWLRNGGEQWVTNYSANSSFGANTLKELKQKIAFNLQQMV